MPLRWWSMSEVVFHRLDRDRVMQELRRYAKSELANRRQIREAVLIGSLARGDWSARSDADVVIVIDDPAAPEAFRGPAYAPRVPLSVDVDVFAYTAQEAHAWSPRFRAEVERGLLLYRRER